MTNYADILERAAIQRQFDTYFWQEHRQARRDEATKDLADKIADEVIQSSKDNAHRRSSFIEELIDGESFESLMRDLLDDVQAGVNPTETIRRKVRNWALSVAEYEVERGEHD